MRFFMGSVLTGLCISVASTQAFAAADLGVSDEVQPADVSKDLGSMGTDTQALKQQLIALQNQIDKINTALAAEEQHHAEIIQKARDAEEKADSAERKAYSSREDYLKKADVLTNENIAEAIFAHSMVKIGPYLNMRSQFDGFELIVNTPSIREPSRLLKGRYADEKAAQDAGKPLPTTPQLTLSGIVAGTALYEKRYDGNKASQFDLTDAELDSYITANQWVSGFMSIVYDNEASSDSVRPTDSSRVLINKAFVTVGNLAKSPLYMTLGQLYVPFGRFSSEMIVAPLTQDLARTKERALEFGYVKPTPNSFYGEVYAFSSSSGFASERSTINDGGFDVGYDFAFSKRVSGEFGVSAISTITDSDGIQFSGLNESAATESLDNRTPAVDAHVELELDPFSFIAEYVTATHAIDRDSGFVFGSDGDTAKPRAFNAELAYTFKTFGKPSFVGIGYGYTGQAVALGLPTRRYDAAYNISIWKDTLETLELRRDYNYGKSAGAALTNDVLKSNLGKINDVITAKLNVYF